MLPLTVNIYKADKFHNLFCLYDRQNSRHFSNLEPVSIKTRACLVRLSTLKHGSHCFPNTVRSRHRTQYSDRQKVTGVL